MIQRKFWYKPNIELFKCYEMAIRFLRCLKVFQWIESKQMIFMFEKVGYVGTSESHLLNFSAEIFEEISLVQSCRELNDIPFELRPKSFK